VGRTFPYTQAQTSAVTLRGESVGVLRGRCACRGVAFEIADAFVAAYNCHCSNCRAVTGSAFLPWGEIEPETLRLTKGADSLVVQGDADGHHAVRCKECFSLLYYSGYQGTIRIPYGTLVDEPALKPTAHMFVGSKAPWHEILDDLPQYDESPWSS
jgi:hypothetical protein